MTDKKHINDSLKNSNKNFNENCTHEKEQIMIDGVNVSECISLDEWKHCNCCNDLIKTVYPNATKCHTEGDLRCETYPNCYYKQLARKTQECEELKEKSEEIKEDRYNLNMEMYVFDRYRKALEEIEEVIKSPCAEDCVYYEYSRCYDCIKTSILDIIRRAKGEE